MAAPIPSYNSPFDDDDNSSAIVTTLYGLGVKCRAPGDDEDGISTSLHGVVSRMCKLFMKIPESRSNTTTISDINEELTEVLKLVITHQKRKRKGTQHQGVGFVEIANALDKVEKAIRLQDGVGFPNLNKNSPAYEELKEPMQALLDARLKIHEEFNPEEYRTDGKMSVSASGTAIKTQGGNILSENYGAVRYVIPKAYFSSQGPVGSMNDFEGDDAVFNGPRSRLDAPDGILSGNRGVMGRSNFAGAEISTGSGIGSIFCGNSNVRTENGNVLDPVALNMLIAQGYVAASQASSIHHPAAHLPNLPPFVGVNASSQYAQPVLGPNLKNGVRGLYNNNTPGPRSGFSGKYGNGGSNALHYSPQQSSFDPSERGDAPMS